jgi:hypothetical protein
MAARPFLPDVARTRRVVGWILVLVSAPSLAWMIWRAVLGGHPNGAFIFLMAVALGALALGSGLAFWPREYLEIDLETRQFVVFRKGKRSAEGPLEALGPLEVKKRSRVVRTDNHQRTVIEYVVRSAAHSDIDLYSMKTAGKARQKMEGLARAWHLPCQSLGGAVRQPDALDTPLHERLRGDSAARKPMPLSPAWSVRIEPAPMGYAMTSTHRSYVALAPPAVFLVIALLILRGLFSDKSLVDQLVSGARNGDPPDVVFASLLGLSALFMLWLVWTGVRDTFFPGTVHINDRGVSYRGRTMRFRHIEEVTATSCVEIVGDARILALGDTFCSLAAGDAVAHELQRLIIEVAASHEV